MVNGGRHPTSPRLPVLTLPQACPPTLGAFYRGMRVATAVCWVFVPRATAANPAAAPQGMCTAPQRGHNKFSSLYVAARRGMPRLGNKVSSFYGTRGGLAMLAAMRRTSSKIPPVLSSFPSLFRLQRWTELNHSSAGGRRGSGGLAMHGVMRALIARWVALIAMLGLLALVIATSRTPCVPYGLRHTLQMNCR